MGAIIGTGTRSLKARSVIMGRCRWLVIGVVLAGLALVPASASAATKPPLTIGMTFSAYEFDHDIASLPAYGRELNMELATAYATIFHMEPNGEITSDIGTTYQYFNTKKEPNKDFEFAIRHNVKFSDGTPLTAASVVGWFRYMYAQHTQASVGFSEILGVNPKFEAVGKWEVKILLSSPNPDLPTILSDAGPIWGFIGSPKCIADPTLWVTQTCGAGPYVLKGSATVPGSHYMYTPNPYYFDKSQIHFSSVTINVIPDTTTMYQALEAGQLDLAAAGNDASTVASAKSAGFTVGTATNEGLVLYLDANGKNNPALANVKVRQAINYAIDRKAIAQAIGFGYSQPTSEFPNSDATSPTIADTYPYSPSKAKALLAAAGVKGLTLTIHSTGQELLWLPLIEKYLNAVGITVNSLPFNQADSTTYFDTDSIDLSQLAYVPTTSQYAEWLSPSSGLNILGNFSRINKLYNEGLVASDPTSDFEKMWGLVDAKALVAPICTLPIVYESVKKLSNVNVTLARGGMPLVTEMSLS